VAHAVLDIADGRGESQRLRFVRLEDVKRETLRIAAADPGERSELCDQSVD